jgi:hypothetical protein
VLASLAKAGLFRLRAVLVGSVAFQSYSGILSVRLNDGLYRTEDVDIAQDHGISISLDDRLPSVDNLLREVDPTFQPVPHLGENPNPAAYRTATGFKVEFLTPNRGSDDHLGDVSVLPALGVSAMPLRHLDFLIREPVRSVILHDAGVGVLVPAPERYAIHKLIVAASRHETSQSAQASKANKDIAQAQTLIEAMAEAGRKADLGFAWIEAFERGSQWRMKLHAGAHQLQPEHVRDLVHGIQLAAKLDQVDAEPFVSGLASTKP